MRFREILGHAAQIESLKSGLHGGRLPHALLFCGPAGVGKACVGTALIAARFCAARAAAADAATLDACGSCPSCRALSHQNHADFERVQREPPKRDIGIAQIRALQEFLHRKGMHGGGRAALVDEAHRLTEEAQNAFLKTLEEPPPGALLILVTSVLHRLLPTVRSRCALLRFGPLGDADMAAFAAGAGAEAAAIPVPLAQGSPGMLLQLARDGVAAAREDVLNLVLRPQATSAFDFAARLHRHATAALPGATPDAEEVDARERTRDRLVRWLRLLELSLRDLAVLRCGGDPATLYHRDRVVDLTRAAERLDADRLLEATEACDEGVADLRRNVEPLLALEASAIAVRRALHA